MNSFLSPSWQICTICLLSTASSNLFAHSKHRIIAQEASEGIWYNGQFLAISKKKKKKNLLNPKEGGRIIQSMKHTKSTVSFVSLRMWRVLRPLKLPWFSLCTSEYYRAWFGWFCFFFFLCGWPRQLLGLCDSMSFRFLTFGSF